MTTPDKSGGRGVFSLTSFVAALIAGCTVTVAVKSVSSPADFEATAESAITATNASQVLAALEKEIGK